MNLVHLAAAMAWLGGASFMLFAMRPTAMAWSAPERLALMAQAMGRFFACVWVCIAALLGSGLALMLGADMKNAPLGWHLMLGLGFAMLAMFGCLYYLYFDPFRRMRLPVAASDWAQAGQRAGQVARLAQLNLLLVALAIAAVVLLA